MNYSFIDLIASKYWSEDIFDAPHRPQEEEDFYCKYINPAAEKDFKAGTDMESCYLASITAWRNAAFREGFKAGAAIMAECFL
ncbi:MAG: hypothetical protein Q4G33_14885 [bacterium]|nr:hypothetical protein [bacterium]